MSIVILLLFFGYFAAMAYLYFFQSSLIFKALSIEEQAPFSLLDTKHISLHVKEAVLQGVYKKAKNQNAPLILYFGGNADDATRFLLHVRNIDTFDIVAFNYRGYVNSTGKPSQEALFSDAKKIYDTYAKEKEVVLVGRSLGTGVVSYLASQRAVKSLILITPYDSIVSMAKKQYPLFPIDFLLKHKFESDKYILHVKVPVHLIEVKDDTVVPKYHFDKLRKNIQNLGLHVELSDTTHGEVLAHRDFEKTMKRMLDANG